MPRKRIGKTGSGAGEQWYRINTIEEGVKELLIQDPDGYLLRFQQYLGEREISES